MNSSCKMAAGSWWQLIYLVGTEETVTEAVDNMEFFFFFTKRVFLCRLISTVNKGTTLFNHGGEKWGPCVPDENRFRWRRSRGTV